MSVKKADFSRLARVGAAIERDLTAFMADVVRTDTDPYVPDATNSLAGSAFAHEADLREGRIVYGDAVNNVSGEPVNNYAQAQYRGLPNKSRDRHPQATAEWDKASIAANGERWREIAERQAEAIARRTK